MQLLKNDISAAILELEIQNLEQFSFSKWLLFELKVTNVIFAIYFRIIVVVGIICIPQKKLSKRDYIF